MRWSANARGYQRLRDVLRRLKALTIIYENAWWMEPAGATRRNWPPESSPNIASFARAGDVPKMAKFRQVGLSGRPASPKPCQRQPEAARSGAGIQLRLPTSRRMYRFLDKRFHGSGTVELDLMDFACGHIGLTEARNVATIKQRLAPAIEELESIGFIEPTNRQSRYKRIRRGVWRIVFRTQTADGPTGDAAATRPAHIKCFTGRPSCYRLLPGLAGN